MSKKRKKTETEPVQSASVIIETTEVEEIDSSLTEEEAPAPQTFNIEEASRHFISGYQARWLPSLKAFAKTHSHGEQHSEAEWKILFKHWGADLK